MTHRNASLPLEGRRRAITPVARRSLQCHAAVRVFTHPPGHPPDGDATRDRAATGDDRRMGREACVPGTWRPVGPLDATARRGPGPAAAAGLHRGCRGRGVRRRRNSPGNHTPQPADTGACGPVVQGTSDTGAMPGRWHRGRRSSRPRAAPTGLSPRWYGPRARGSGQAAGPQRHADSAVRRAERRAVYAASAFRYAVMAVIMPDLPPVGTARTLARCMSVQDRARPF